MRGLLLTREIVTSGLPIRAMVCVTDLPGNTATCSNTFWPIKSCDLRIKRYEGMKSGHPLTALPWHKKRRHAKTLLPTRPSSGHLGHPDTTNFDTIVIMPSALTNPDMLGGSGERWVISSPGGGHLLVCKHKNPVNKVRCIR
jgi:hypothetical protein